jgi:exodeoxyribonuclease VII small subunit
MPMAKKLKKSDGPDEAAEVTFEQALGELEQVVGELEHGRLGLSDSLAAYEKGVFFLRRCYDLLEKAEKKIGILSGTDENGRPIVKPLEDESGATLEEKAESRSRRRTATAPGEPVRRRPNNPDDDGVDLPGGLF